MLLSLVSAAAQSELWAEPKGARGSAEVEPKVRTEPWLRPNEKFDYFLAHLRLHVVLGSAKRLSQDLGQSIRSEWRETMICLQLQVTVSRLMLADSQRRISYSPLIFLAIDSSAKNCRAQPCAFWTKITAPLFTFIQLLLISGVNSCEIANKPSKNW